MPHPNESMESVPVYTPFSGNFGIEAIAAIEKARRKALAEESDRTPPKANDHLQPNRISFGSNGTNPVTSTDILLRTMPNISETTPLLLKQLKEEPSNISRVLHAFGEGLMRFVPLVNSATAFVVPPTIGMSIFPEVVPPATRVITDAAIDLGALLAYSVAAYWADAHRNESNPRRKKRCFEAFANFLKSPVGVPISSYTMLLCFKTLGEYHPTLPDNVAMLSVIASLFAFSLVTGVLTHLGANSDVNPSAVWSRRDVANAAISFISGAAIIAQIDRLARMNLDQTTYAYYFSHMLLIEVAVAGLYALLRTSLPLVKFRRDLSNIDREDALSIMNHIKSTWREADAFLRFFANLAYIAGLAIEAEKLLPRTTAHIVAATFVGVPLLSTLIGEFQHRCRGKQVAPGMAKNGIFASVNSSPERRQGVQHVCTK